jgi:hypothetical protein
VFVQHLRQRGVIEGIAGGFGDIQRASRLLQLRKQGEAFAAGFEAAGFIMLNENNPVRRAHQTINLRDAALARQTRRGEHAVLHIHDHHYPLSRHCSLPRTFSQTVIIRAGEKSRYPKA